MKVTEELIERHLNRIGGPLSALREISETDGYINDEQSAMVAFAFNISRAEVRGIISFYSDLKSEPRAKHVLKICQAEACQASGSRQFTRDMEQATGAPLGGQNLEQTIELESVYCLGLCANGPAAMLDGRLIAHANHELLAIIEGEA